MRCAGLLALMCAAAMAQEPLPPVGAYDSLAVPAAPRWPDPATLSPSQRQFYEIELRIAREREEAARDLERRHNMTDAERRVQAAKDRRLLTGQEDPKPSAAPAAPPCDERSTRLCL